MGRDASDNVREWLIIIENDTHFRTAGDRREVNRARVRDVRITDGLPRNETVLDVIDDLRIPLYLLATREASHPVRVHLIDALNRIQVLHEARQIGEVAPHPIEICRGPRDVDASLDLDCLTSIDRRGATGHVVAMATRR